MKEQTKGLIYGAVASSSYGTNPLFALPLYAAGIGINSVLFYRYALAVLIYGIWLKLIKKTSLKLEQNEVLPLFFLGILFSLSSLTLFGAFKYIDAGIACTILFIYPVLVALIMATFFKEKLTKTIVGSILLISIGIILLYKNGGGAGLNLHGVLIVLLSALLYAVYMVGVKTIKSIKDMGSEKMSFYVMLFGLLVYIINLKFCTQLQMLNSPILWGSSFGLALLPTIISIETINIAIKLIGSTKTAILGALEPLTAVFFGVVVFHEHLSFRIVVGILFVLFGVMQIVLQKQKA